MTNNEVKRTYTRREAKEIIGCCLATIDQLIRDGRLRAIRLSPRRIVIPASALEEYLNGNS